MREKDLTSHVGSMVTFQYSGLRYRGRLMKISADTRNGDDQDVPVLIELPTTLITLSLSADDVISVEADAASREPRPRA